MAKGTDQNARREALRKELAEISKGEVTRLKGELDAHDAKFESIRAERDRLNDQINELIEKRNEVARRLAEGHSPEHARLANALSGAARDAGGKSLSDLSS
jgi:uncharacterized coiled-coil DUF342 family protein